MAGAALAGAVTRPGYAAENNTIKIALVGCGGRGSGAAAQALSTQGPTKLWAMADLFENRLQSSLAGIRQQHEKQVDAPPERQFIGMDAYKKAIDSLDKGRRRVAGHPAGLPADSFRVRGEQGDTRVHGKILCGGRPGHPPRSEERRSGQGKESESRRRSDEPALPPAGGGGRAASTTARSATSLRTWAYRMHGPVGFGAQQPGMNELAYQIANYSCFTWLNGSFLLDWLIHNIDVACWVKNDWPVSVQGMGGRQVRQEADQLFDHYGAEYTFADGTRMFAQGRHMSQCWDFWGVVVHGAKGSRHHGRRPTQAAPLQRPQADLRKRHLELQGPECNPYQHEHDLLFDAIRNDKPYNETERCAKSCFTGIMGRMACESGKQITWEEGLASEVELAPGLERLAWDGPAPAQPRADGRYDIAMPGQTKVM